MEKRGISDHLDWVIAFGVFVVFITFILVSLGPRLTEKKEPQVVLDLIEDKFLEQTSWTLLRVPFWIDYKEGINDCGTFPFTGWSNSNSRMYKETGNWEGDYDINGFKFEIGETNNGNFIILKGDDTFGLDGSLSCPNEGCETGCEVRYGIPEELKGISCDKVNTLVDYNTVKNLFVYSGLYDFNITISSGDCPLDIGPNNPIPYTSEVYVRQVSALVLDEDGTFKPINILIKVW